MQHSPVLALLILAALSMACSLTTPTPPTQEGEPLPAEPSPAWVSLHTPTTPTPTHQAEPAAAPACVVVAQALNIRACPGVSCGVVGYLANGDQVQAAAAPGVVGWLELSHPAGGYISARWCQFSEGR